MNQSFHLWQVPRPTHPTLRADLPIHGMFNARQAPSTAWQPSLCASVRLQPSPTIVLCFRVARNPAKPLLTCAIKRTQSSILDDDDDDDDLVRTKHFQRCSRLKHGKSARSSADLVAPMTHVALSAMHCPGPNHHAIASLWLAKSAYAVPLPCFLIWAQM